MFKRGRAIAAVLVTAVFCLAATDAGAVKRRLDSSSQGGISSSGKYAAFVVDAKTGRTLFARNENAPRHPASLTKIMTLYILFEEMQQGRLSLSSPLTVSARAASQAPSKLGLRPGSTIIVGDAIKALVTKSANDVAVTVAENIGSSEADFAKRMTQTARRLGMNGTVFRNASGLPDMGQITTARDMVTLGRAIQDRFPDQYRYFSIRSFAWGDSVIGSHNRLLGRVDGVDGIKTGYTQASGFNLVSSVRRDGRQVVAAVMGGPTARARDNHMVKLLEAALPSASRGPKTDAVADSGAIGVSPKAVARAADQRPLTAFVAAAAKPDARPTTDVETGSVENGAAVAMAKAILLPDRVVPAAGVASASQPKGVRPLLPPVGMMPAPPVGRSAAPTTVAQVSPITPSLAPATGVGNFAPPAAPSVDAEESPRVMSLAEAKIDIREVDNRTTQSVPRSENSGEATRNAPAVEPASLTRTGWMIQVGATDSEAGARALLAKAKDKAGALLSRRDSFTMSVAKGQSMIYRARFAGFADQSAANAACQSLKRKDFACLALRQ